MTAYTGFVEPTIAEIAARLQSEIDSRVAGSDVMIAGTDLYALAWAVAGESGMLHESLTILARDLWPDTARADMLDRWGGILGVTRQAGDRATGSLTITATAAVTVPEGTLIEADDGTRVEVDADEVYAAAGSESVACTAVDRGTAGNLAHSQTLTFVSPIAYVSSSAPTVAAFTGGTDAEDDDDYRDRILIAWRAADYPATEGGYRSDALAALSAAREVWVSCPAAGYVYVYFDLDETGSDVLPTSTQCATVEDYLTDTSRATVGITVSCPELLAEEIDLEISGYTETGAACNDAAQDAIEAALEAMLRRLREPGGTIYNSQIRDAIGSAVGTGDLHHYTLDSVQGGSATADVEAAAGYLPTLGTITWS